MKYLSTFEVAEKWGISHRRVGILCNENRIPGAQRAGGRWIIPENAEKPERSNKKKEQPITLLDILQEQKQKIDANRKGGAEHGAQILIRQHQRAFAGFDERT